MDSVTEASLRVSSEARRQIAFLKSRSQSQAVHYQIRFYQWIAENSDALIKHVLNLSTSIIKDGE